jgi:CDGSH-type Zn-finger protein
MIRVANTTPGIVSFEQTVAKGSTAQIASAQIAKASAELGSARVEMDNATFRLQKAEESMKATKIAYFEAVEKSAWNKDELRKSYNNALAGYREADARFAKASEVFTTAESVFNSLNDLAKGKTPKALRSEADAHDKKTEEAKASGDFDAVQQHAQASAKLRAEAKEMEDDSNEEKRGQEVSDVAKREFSDAKRQSLAQEGKAMPDGSYPIETKGDLANAVQSFGRAKSPAQVKSHIIRQAQALNAVDLLPEEWMKPAVQKAEKGEWKKPWLDDSSDESSDDSSDDTGDDSSKEAPAKTVGKAQAWLVICPTCGGEDDTCPTCDGTGSVPEDQSDETSDTSDEMTKAKKKPAVAESPEDDSTDDSEMDDSGMEDSDSDEGYVAKSAFSTESLLYPHISK